MLSAVACDLISELVTSTCLLNYFKCNNVEKQMDKYKQNAIMLNNFSCLSPL